MKNYIKKKVEEKPGDHMKIPSKIVAVVIAIICAFASLGLSGEYKQILSKEWISGLLLTISQFIAGSLCVNFLLNLTDLQKIYDELENKIEGILDRKLENPIGHIQEISKDLRACHSELEEVTWKIKHNYDYITNPDKFPFDMLTDTALSELFDKAAEQKIKNKEKKLDLNEESDIGKLYKDWMKNFRSQYLRRIETLESGFINVRYRRDIKLEPQSKENVIKINTTIIMEMYIPQNVDEENRRYKYSPHFSNKEDAESFVIERCTVNNNSVSVEAKKLENEKEYFRIHEVLFECKKKNTYHLVSHYELHETEFREIYRIMDDCKEYAFLCELTGEEKDGWYLDVSVSEVKLVNESENALLVKNNDDNMCEVSTDGKRWVLAGTTITVKAKRKKND